MTNNNCDYCNKDMYNSNIVEIYETGGLKKINHKVIEIPFTCRRCGGHFCSKHRLPENHECLGL